ncbi:hypothetical protein L2737_06230 [Shewanella electrodiphila]|uniref:Uncharacterized protein n=1 Tax=Shewanella electrodiphila TaxID=934143 RepID=A0ABT0KM49_9GAMM|nr:hypothetical protein [Shewanella electrodiphila]MCL1044925.1 hypothetical protein [Shewanella electrodiphila]
MDLERAGKITSMLAIVIPIVLGGVTYAIDLNNTRINNNFKNFHDLIAEIYDGGRKGYSGSQRALIYELTNFPEYIDFTCRELPRMKETFTNAKTDNEIDSVFKMLKCS